jgi:hypothetical protein
MRNCQEMTKLVSDSFERRLTLSERLEMRFHMLMCRLCHQFLRNSRTLAKRMGEVVSQVPLPLEDDIRDSDHAASTPVARHLSGPPMPAEAKQRLLRRVMNAVNGRGDLP